jgi:TatD DNase family protein
VRKPLMIHDRDAHADVLRILREEGAPEQVVFHAFSGDEAVARECVRAGYLLSFPGVITFKNAPALRAAAAVVPIDQLLVETDAPFLTPHPFRGRPNSPRLLPLTAQGLAAATGYPLDELCAAMAATGARVFGIGALGGTDTP